MPLFHATDAAFPSALLEARVRSTTPEAKCGSIGLKRRKLLVGVLERRTAQPAGVTGLRIGHVRRQRKTGFSNNDSTIFWHWTVGKWIWNDRTGECASINSNLPSHQRVKTFILPWTLLSYELPLLWGLHDDDSSASTATNSSSSEAELVIPQLPRKRSGDTPKLMFERSSSRRRSRGK